MPVKLHLPAGHEPQFRQSLTQTANFRVTDLGQNWVSLQPAEGVAQVKQYFQAHRVASAKTDLADPSTWDIVQRCPPWGQKPAINPPKDLMAYHASLYQRSDLPSVAKRLSVETLLSNAQTLPGAFQKELPDLFARYPHGSLWYISVTFSCSIGWRRPASAELSCSPPT